MIPFLANVPQPILWGCYALLLAFAVAVVWLTRQSAKMRSQIGRFTSALQRAGEMDRAARHQGLPLSKIDELRAACADLEGAPAEWWDHIDGSIEAYTSPEEQEGYFITERPRNILSYDGTVGRHFHSTFFASFPGLLTGSGLALTFIAILLALHEVQYDARNSAKTRDWHRKA